MSTRPRLGAALWPADAYVRDALPERVLQFGTGMLLRALPVALVDAANRAGRFGGRVVVVQSTAGGLADAMNAQDGLFTLVERGAEDGEPVERTRVVGAISRALVAAHDWPAIRDVAASPELRVVVSNVTEAGFRIADGETLSLDDAAPASFPAKLTALLYHRFRRASDAPTLFVIPTELVDDNGGRLRAMVEQLASSLDDADAFRAWLAERVRFCSSLVDRITTGTPEPSLHAQLEARAGYDDALLTVAEPYALWAVEGDPDALRGAFAIDEPARDDAAREPPVIFARDIGRYRERKIRLLNGAHTALAPLARLARVATVREAVAHPALGAFLRHVLYEEIVPSTDLPRAEAERFAASVLDRFANPWLDHAWSVIATNQTTKMRNRVVPSIVGYAAKRGTAPRGLALAIAAYLRHARSKVGERGAWVGCFRGDDFDVVDADLALVVKHWHDAEGPRARGPIPREVSDRVVASSLADAALWGRRLDDIPGLVATTSRSLAMLQDGGVERTIDAALADDAPLPS